MGEMRCILCQKPFASVQMTLDNAIAKKLNLCFKCQKTSLEDHVIIYDPISGWAAKVEDEEFTKWIWHTIPENRFLEMSKEKAQKIADEMARCDEDYTRQIASLQNLYEEMEYHETELAQLTSQAESTKADLAMDKEYYFDELFKKASA